MYFTSQSAKRAFLALMILIVFSSLIYFTNAVAECDITDETTAESTHYYFCDQTYTVDGYSGDCDSICSFTGIRHCKTTQNPKDWYGEGDCYADFDFVTNYGLITDSELNQFIDKLYALVGEGKGQLLLDNSNFYPAIAATSKDVTVSLLTMLDANSLGLLSTITPLFGVASNDGAGGGLDILTAALNYYVAGAESLMPFDEAFGCALANANCAITGSSGSLTLDFNKMLLPLDQFTGKQGVSITTDITAGMLKLYSTADGGEPITGISCGSNSGISTSLFASGAYFECDSTMAIVTPGASMEYNGFTFENQCGSGESCTNDIYFGNCAGKEGICIDGDKISFNNVEGFIVKKGCLTLYVNDKGADSTDLCVENSDYSDSAASCAESFEFQCSNGMTGLTSNNCALYDFNQDLQEYEGCTEFGTQEVGPGEEADECACAIAGTPLTGSACGQEAGLAPEEDLTFQQLQDMYPNCKVCPSSAGMEQYMCERALASGEVADYEKIAKMVRDGIEKCKNAPAPTSPETQVTAGCKGGVLPSGSECKSLTNSKGLCKAESYNVIGSAATMKCATDNGGTAFITTDSSVLSNCNGKAYVPTNTLKTMVCDKVNRKMDVSVTGTVYFGVYGGIYCSAGSTQVSIRSADQPGEFLDGTCGSIYSRSCNGKGALGMNGTNGTGGTGTSNCKDNDHDGFSGKSTLCSSGNDCNDNNATIKPGAKEVCGNSIDEDCSGKADACEKCEGCLPCNAGDKILCIGNTTLTAEDKTCSYYRGCNVTKYFDEDCVKLDSNCLEHGTCLESQILSCPRQFGVCAGSKQECGDDLKWPGCDYSAIEGYSESEICNDGLDNDCDSSIDEGCPCYGAPDLACGSIVGECKAGKQECVNNKWTDCKNYIMPKPEKADGKDNDCDGSIDEWTNCGISYTEGFSRPCGVNSCGEGEQFCLEDVDNALKFTECTGNVVPTLETCQDDIDNDCDGSVNEGCGCMEDDERECGSSDTGICKKGLQKCVNNMLGTCTGVVNPQEEKCDNLDNDCDGSIDEGCPCIDILTKKNLTSKPCALQLGICKGMNSTCVNGMFEACQYSNNFAYQKDRETKCDDLWDNDCDGKVDGEDADCVSTGDNECSDGTLPGECSATKPYYCASGLMLENRCGTCKCSSGETCSSSGNCLPETCGNGKCEAGENIECPGDCKPRGEVDSDGDGLTDEQEAVIGTNPLSKDTDSDMLNDKDDEKPLCNSNGICDDLGDYPETETSCPEDCAGEITEVKTNCLIWLVLSILLVGFGLSYFVYKDNKELISKKQDIVKLEKTNALNLKEKKKEFDGKKVKFRNKLLIDLIIIVLGLLLLLTYLIRETPLLPCSADVTLAILIALAFGAYLYYMYWKKKQAMTASAKVTQPITAVKKEMEEHKNVEQLNQYVKTALERGIKEDKVKSICISTGWSQAEINSAISRAKTRVAADKFADLRNYMQKAVEKKIKEADIKQKLLKAGWKKEIIDVEFAKIRK